MRSRPYLVLPSSNLPLVIKHFSFSKVIADHDEKLLEEMRSKLVEIDLVDKMNDICSAVKYQDTVLANALTKKYHHFFYYGIAHTPFIFRLGLCFDDGANIHLLHKKRDNNSLFCELKQDGSENMHLEKVTIFADNQSTELLVAISTSLSIVENDLGCFNPSSMHQLRFNLQGMDFDSISSYAQMKRYRHEILHLIRDFSKKYGIVTIHLMASTSAAFSFFIGQGISKTHDPKVIVYHYEKNSKPCYPWGLRIQKAPDVSLVYNMHNNTDSEG